MLGIITFLSAVWAMLDFPSLKMMLQLPVWIWAVLVITFSQAINEALSRRVSNKLNIWVNNFWVGLSTVFFSLAALLILAGSAGVVKLSITNTFILGSIAIGCVVVAMISFKLLSYASGAAIASKKLVMQGSYLITATFAGILVYDEPFTAGKVAGIMLFLVAFVLTDSKTRGTIFHLRGSL